MPERKRDVPMQRKERSEEVNFGQVTAAAMEELHRPSPKWPFPEWGAGTEHCGGRDPLGVFCKAGPSSRRGSPLPSTAGAFGPPIPRCSRGPRAAVGHRFPPRSPAALCQGGAASKSQQPRANANAQLSPTPQEPSAGKHAKKQRAQGNPPAKALPLSAGDLCNRERRRCWW